MKINPFPFKRPFCFKTVTDPKRAWRWYRHSGDICGFFFLILFSFYNLNAATRGNETLPSVIGSSLTYYTGDAWAHHPLQPGIRSMVPRTRLRPMRLPPYPARGLKTERPSRVCFGFRRQSASRATCSKPGACCISLCRRATTRIVVGDGMTLRRWCRVEIEEPRLSMR